MESHIEYVYVLRGVAMITRSCWCEQNTDPPRCILNHWHMNSIQIGSKPLSRGHKLSGYSKRHKTSIQTSTLVNEKSNKWYVLLLWSAYNCFSLEGLHLWDCGCVLWS